MIAKVNFPRADEDPKLKRGHDWLLQYAKATWEDSKSMPNTMFFHAAAKYQELRDLALGKQDVNKYKPLLMVDEGASESWLSIDWSTRPVHTKFRDIFISKILQRKFRIGATPIDALGKSKMDEYFADKKAKIKLREIAARMQDEELLNSPALALDPQDPEDMDQLQMQMQYGIKLDVAIMAEKGIKLVFYQNDIEDVRKQVVEDLFDLGVGGIKETLDDNGSVIVRRVDPANLICNFVRNGNFPDREIKHMGEIIEVPLTEMSAHFTNAEMESIVDSCRGKDGNPEYASQSSTYNMGYDGFKAKVLDLELITDDVIVYERRIDARGNKHTNKSKFKNKDKSDSYIDLPDGTKEKKYVNRTMENIYKIKWVMGTDLCYEYGLANNMKRVPEKKYIGQTSMSYHLYAYNFNNMRAQSMMERLRPVVDDYHMTHYKLQNLKNRMVASGWAIDLDALEGVDLAKSGENMTPIKVLEMYFQSGILVYRGSTLDQSNPNRKPLEQLVNSYGQELTSLAGELERLKQEMRDVTGLNEITDGSTPSDRMLNGVSSLAEAGTNNAIFPIMQADRRILERTAKGVIQRLQIAVRNGDIEGVVNGIGAGAVEFVRVTGDIGLHNWGIMIQDIPDDEERQMLLQQLNLKDAQGQIDPEDWVTIYSIDDIKEARQFLAWKIKKRKEEAQQMQQQIDEANTQRQIQSAQAAEEAKRQTAREAHQAKMEEINLEKQWDFKIRSMERSMQHETSLVSTAMQSNANAASSGTQPMFGLPEQEEEPQEQMPQQMPQEMMQQ